MEWENILGPLLTLAFYGVLGVAFLALLSRPGRLRTKALRGDDLRDIAGHLGGQVATDSTTDFPFVRFTLGGARAYFVRWMFGGTLPIISTIEVNLPGGAFFEATGRRCVRYPTWSRRFREVPDPGKGFRIVTSDPEWAARFLDRGGADLLRRLGRNTRIRLQITASRVSIEVEQWLDADGVRRLAELATGVVGLLSDPEASRGIEILSVSHAPAGAVCPVCAFPAEPPLVSCGTCRVPHHSDCWTYLARCAIFGCNGKSAA